MRRRRALPAADDQEQVMKEADDFFAIDINAFSKVCLLGANAAAA
jgi:hypothetical protein